jgi:hypothetical protein
MAGSSDGNLVLEVIAATGLSSHESFFSHKRNMQLHVIYDNEHSVTSPEVLYASDEVQFNFSCSFPLEERTLAQVKVLNRPIHLYISQSIALNASSDYSPAALPADYQPAGGVFTRTLVAQAVIDTRLAFLHKDEFLSVELVQCDNSGIVNNGFSGAIFVKLSFEGLMLAKSVGLGPADLEEVQNNIERHQKHVETLNFEQYQTVKAMYSKCRATFPYVEDRKIKLISLDECGRYRMVSNFVGAITPPRDIDRYVLHPSRILKLSFEKLPGVGLKSCW